MTISRSLPMPPPGPKIEWELLGDRGRTSDGYRVCIFFGRASRRWIAEVWTPNDKSHHMATAPSTVDAKRAAAWLIHDLRRVT